MRSPVAPPPSKPDSVELLRKRTGTPRLGVPVDPRLPAQSAVAGVITATPAVRAEGQPVARAEGQPVARAVEPGHLPPPTQPDDAQARGKRQSAGSADLNISQVWYDEGDQLSGDPVDDEPSTRGSRARKLISPSVTDLSLIYDERPRRRWGLLAGVGVFAVIGVTVALAVTRGGSSTDEATSLASRPQPSATAPTPIDAAPSTILPPDQPAAEVAAAPPATATPPAATPTPATATPPAATPPPAVASADTPPAAAGKSPVAPKHRPARVAVETHASATARRPTDRGASYPVLGSEPTRRSPGSGTTTPAVTAPDPGKGPATPSLTDNPKDPYGGDDTPSDGVAPEKKAEFFANLGSQQLIGGDTAGAAANFKKALELDGKNVAAATGMGEIALRQGLFGDAIAHLTKAAKLAPKSSKVLTLLGEAYLNSGNSTQAAAQFKKALQLDPDNARARDGYNEASSRVAPPQDEAP
jgi:hypothetical protein